MEEKTEEYLKVRARAIKYIMYRVRTSHEVYSKLIELEFSEKVVADCENSTPIKTKILLFGEDLKASTNSFAVIQS